MRIILLTGLLLAVFLPLGGCVYLAAGAWANHDYNYHCYNPHRPVASWCRDHR